MTEIHCLKCNKKVKPNSASYKEMKTGAILVTGTCPHCNKGIAGFQKKK